MKKILLIHGPNLNLLGLRDKKHYGDLTLRELEKVCKLEGVKHHLKVLTFQSNHEGEIIDWIQRKSAKVSGIIINPGALTHYSYALYDALTDTKLPCIEVHLSDVKNREKWRAVSVITPACIAVVSGKKEQGYRDAIFLLKQEL